mgnify:CR=1 FL=1
MMQQANLNIGSIGQQGGTLMHELGHTLGLRHGGNVETNDKPNYLSVMNYSFQRCIVPASPGLLPGGLMKYKTPLRSDSAR